MNRYIIPILAVLVLIALLLLVLFTGPKTENTSSVTEPPTTAAPELPPVTMDLNLYCFQAGKADALLIWNEAGAVLIDTGVTGYGKTIVEKMTELGLERLDALILTHFDNDHVGGAKKVLISFPVGTVYQSNYPRDSSAYEKYLKALTENNITPVTVRETQTFTLGDAVFTINAPKQEVYSEDPSNNSSLIVTVQHGENRILLCGDAEDQRMTEFLQKDPGSCTLVKMPHHGAWQTTLTSLIEKTQPAWALITSSDEEPEDPRTIELLTQNQVQCLLTRTAPILAVSDGKTLTVQYTE